MSEYEPMVLPPAGLITYSDLVKFLKTTDETLITSLRKNKIPILKLGSYRRMWVIRLEDLKGSLLTGTGDEGES